jgi:hypothetical protein
MLARTKPQDATDLSELFPEHVNNSTTEHIALDKMFVEPSYGNQRPAPTDDWVAKIVKTFDPNALRNLTVSDRGNGAYAILDGQGRRLVLLKLKIATAKCDVLHGLSLSEEAAIFLKLNTFRQVTQATKFASRVAFGDRQASKIDSILRKQGYRVGIGGKKGISNADTLEKIFSDVGVTPFDRTINILG